MCVCVCLYIYVYVYIYAHMYICHVSNTYQSICDTACTMNVYCVGATSFCPTCKSLLSDIRNRVLEKIRDEHMQKLLTASTENADAVAQAASAQAAEDKAAELAAKQEIVAKRNVEQTKKKERKAAAVAAAAHAAAAEAEDKAAALVAK